jgi:hypothetical protein
MDGLSSDLRWLASKYDAPAKLARSFLLGMGGGMVFPGDLRWLA